MQRRAKKAGVLDDVLKDLGGRFSRRAAEALRTRDGGAGLAELGAGRARGGAPGSR